MGTIIQMAATSAGGTESSLASIDIPLAGEIVGVSWACNTDFDTTLDDQVWQLSFGSAANLINDSRQVISVVSLGGMVVLTAVGAVMGQANFYHALPELPVGMGERLFLHSVAAAAVVGRAICLVHFSFDLDKVAVRRR